MNSDQVLPRQDEKEGEGFLVGLILGSLIGAGLSLFFTGKEGRALRRLLLKKGKVFLKDVEKVKEESQEKLNEQVERLNEETSEKLGDLSEKAGEKIETIEKTGRKTLGRFFLKAGKKLVQRV
jgi:gas vesicle protein